MYKENEEWMKWTLEFIDVHGGLEKALEYAGMLKNTIYPMLINGRVSKEIAHTDDLVYISAARKLWEDFFKKSDCCVPNHIIDKLSKDKGAPWVAFAILKYKAVQEGYRGGNRDFDEISKELMPGGALY